MRTKLNLSSTPGRRVPDKLAMSGMSLSRMPLGWFEKDWLSSGSWRLPSGKALGEFALQSGFLAPLLFNGEPFGAKSPASGVHGPERERSSDERERSGDDRERAIGSRAKNFGKGSSH